jgi:tripeptide aminopeptidase
MMKRFAKTVLFCGFLYLISPGTPVSRAQTKETVVDRFIRYTQFATQSREDVDSIPSTPGQFMFAHALVAELQRLGVADASVDRHCYVYASIPGTLPESLNAKIPAIALISHLDTSPEVSGDHVRAIIHKHYSGGPIILGPDSSVILSPDNAPHLSEYIGSDIITSDGTTLLGADDKAGIAEIMTAIEQILDDTRTPHGVVKIVFTPDEEVDNGAAKFDLAACGAQYAYTIDGGHTGEISNETWNADEAVVTFHGKNTHPGNAKGVMVNSLYLLTDFVARLPEKLKPETTDRRSGFLHPYTGSIDVQRSKLKFLLRSFDLSGLEKERSILHDIRRQTLEKFPGGAIDIDIKESYRNMRLKLDRVPFVTEYAVEACRRAGVVPEITPIRGGTDGSIITELGLPCPNLFTGGESAHSLHEWIPVRGMESAVQTIINLTRLWTEKSMPKK